MSRIRLFAAALLGTAVLGVATAGVASASIALTYKATSYTETFKLVSPTSFHFVASDVTGYKVTSKLSVTCVFTRPISTSTDDCVFTLTFTNGTGTLFGTAVVPPNSNPAITVVGGTKSYLGARGTGTSVNIDPPYDNISVLTFHYVLP